MTASLSELLAQKAALEKEIKEAQSEARSEAISRIRSLMTEHRLTVADLTARPSTAGGTKTGAKVAPKYRDPLTGSTWTGRGLKPKWLTAALAEGKSIIDFAI